MLVLTRQAGESITLDGDIQVKVLRVIGQQVRIGITAPKNIGIVRDELEEEPKTGNRSTSDTMKL